MFLPALICLPLNLFDCENNSKSYEQILIKIVWISLFFFFKEFFITIWGVMSCLAAVCAVWVLYCIKASARVPMCSTRIGTSWCSSDQEGPVEATRWQLTGMKPIAVCRSPLWFHLCISSLKIHIHMDLLQTTSVTFSPLTGPLGLGESTTENTDWHGSGVSHKTVDWLISSRRRASRC